MAGKRRKKRTHHLNAREISSTQKMPKSFVFRLGKVSHGINALVKDFRRVMEPNTASRLKERKNNKLKDFLAVAGPLGVTHLIMFTKNDSSAKFRIFRAPRGPVMNFKINQYSLAKDVLANQINPRSPGQEYLQSPLLVLNNFNSGDKDVKLMATMFQNMFPSLNVQQMHLADCRRVVLLDYDSETRHITFRHYYITVKSVGLSKSVKKIINTQIPDLNKFEDYGEYVLRDAAVSESDVEDADDNNNMVTLADKYHGRNNKESEQRAIKLKEIGPRIEFKLTKIQETLQGEYIFTENPPKKGNHSAGDDEETSASSSSELSE